MSTDRLKFGGPGFWCGNECGDHRTSQPSYKFPDRGEPNQHKQLRFDYPEETFDHQEANCIGQAYHCSARKPVAFTSYEECNDLEGLDEGDRSRHKSNDA